jgi:hypothetical protein
MNVNPGIKRAESKSLYIKAELPMPFSALINDDRWRGEMFGLSYIKHAYRFQAHGMEDISHKDIRSMDLLTHISSIQDYAEDPFDSAENKIKKPLSYGVQSEYNITRYHTLGYVWRGVNYYSSNETIRMNELIRHTFLEGRVQ